MIERHPIASYAHGCYVTSMSKNGSVGQWETFYGDGLMICKKSLQRTSNSDSGQGKMY